MPKTLTPLRRTSSLLVLGLCATGMWSCGKAPAAPTPSTVPAEAANQEITVEQVAEPAPVASRGHTTGEVHLMARRELGLGARPLGACAADFDADGYADLAVVIEKPGQVRVFFGGPNGLSNERQARLDIGDYPIAPVVFGTPPRIAVASAETKQLAIIDVGDGAAAGTLTATGTLDLDATPRALAALAGSAGQLYLADRFGGLHALTVDAAGVRETSTIDIGARPVGVLALADGSVVALTQSDESLHLFRTASNGQLEATQTLPFDGIPRSAGEADLDGDGDLEQIFLGGDRRVLVFGLGKPAPARFSDTPGAGKPLKQIGLVPMALAVADLDRDGKQDLVSLGQNDQGYSVMGSFTAAGTSVSLSEYAGQDPWDLAVADYDGDGLEDLAVACRGANSISLMPGTGLLKNGKPAFAQARRVKVGTNPLGIAALDMNGDDKPEVATLDAADGSLSILVNDSFGSLRLATRIPVGGSPAALQSARFQGPDRPTELMLLAEPAGGSGRLVVLGKQRGGEFGILEVRGPNGDRVPASTTAGLLAHDVDMDGTDDLVMLDLVNRSLATYRVEPRKEGEPIVLVPLGAPITWTGDDHPTSMAVLVRKDQASDARVPLLAVGLAKGVALIDAATGDQVGQVARPQRTGPRTQGPSRLLAADLDGDGSDDLVALWLGSQGTSPGNCSAHLFVGSLKEQVVATVATGLAPAGFAAADLNLDGTEDLVLAAQNSHAANLWLTSYREGKLILARQSDLGVGLGPLEVTFADLIGKGSLDILVSNAFSSDVSIVINRRK
ncbi:MAG: VCBS repeat-containing protein [Planctomycetota bacterium]|nr:VCBS repeat-containing protein [Planctomycetota bacterium]MDG2144138.1 VCBS repeat-containing protein [Planctomycetota bacterium]